MSETPAGRPISVRVVAFQEGDLWVAQCLEYDIAAHAADLTQLKAAFSKAVLQNVCVNHDLGREGLDGIPRAPARFEAMFEASDLAVKAVRRSRPARTSAPVTVRDWRLASPRIAA